MKNPAMLATSTQGVPTASGVPTPIDRFSSKSLGSYSATAHVLGLSGSHPGTQLPTTYPVPMPPSNDQSAAASAPVRQLCRCFGRGGNERRIDGEALTDHNRLTVAAGHVLLMIVRSRQLERQHEPSPDWIGQRVIELELNDIPVVGREVRRRSRLRRGRRGIGIAGSTKQRLADPRRETSSCCPSDRAQRTIRTRAIRLAAPRASSTGLCSPCRRWPWRSRGHPDW